MHKDELMLEDEPEIICVSLYNTNRCIPDWPCRPDNFDCKPDKCGPCYPDCKPECSPNCYPNNKPCGP